MRHVARAWCMLHVAGCVLHVARCVLHAARCAQALASISCNVTEAYSEAVADTLCKGKSTRDWELKFSLAFKSPCLPSVAKRTICSNNAAVFQYTLGYNVIGYVQQS